MNPKTISPSTIFKLLLKETPDLSQTSPTNHSGISKAIPL